MKSWCKFVVVVCAAFVLNGQAAGADPVSDIKSYVAAVEGGDWGAAAATADRLLEYPTDSLQISTA